MVRVQAALAAGTLSGVMLAAVPAMAVCGPVEGQSRTRQALTLAHERATPADVKRSYDREFAIGRDQAIADWQAKVRTQCPGASMIWSAAKAKSVTECDRAMGGRFTVCVEAIPGP
jgi:hypothetical protein